MKRRGMTFPFCKRICLQMHCLHDAGMVIVLANSLQCEALVAVGEAGRLRAEL